MALYPWFCLLLLVVIATLQGSSLGGSSQSIEEPQCSEPFENIYYEDETYERPCQRLAAAIMFYVAYARDWAAEHPWQRWEEVKQGADVQLGIDIEDEDQVTELACRLGEVDTLDELAEELNYGEHKDQLKYVYHQAQLFLARIDGFHGLRKASEITLMVQYAVLHLTGQEEGEMVNVSELYRVINVDNLSNLLSNMEELYGSGYLIYYLMRPYNDALVGIDHRVLAQAILDGDIACRLGVSPEIEHEILMHIEDVKNNRRTQDQVDMMFEAYIAADQMGLLNLRS